MYSGGACIQGGHVFRGYMYSGGHVHSGHVHRVVMYSGGGHVHRELYIQGGRYSRGHHVLNNYSCWQL